MELRDEDHRLIQQDLSEVKGDLKAINVKLDNLMKDQEEIDTVKGIVIKHSVEINNLTKFMYAVWSALGMVFAYVIQNVIRNGF